VPTIPGLADLVSSQEERSTVFVCDDEVMSLLFGNILMAQR
jgi:hypothetical protein